MKPTPATELARRMVSITEFRHGGGVTWFVTIGGRRVGSGLSSRYPRERIERQRDRIRRAVAAEIRGWRRDGLI